MKTKSSRFVWGLTFLLLINIFACSPSAQAPAEREMASAAMPDQVKASATSLTTQRDSQLSTQLPVRFQAPEYTLGTESADTDVLGVEEEFSVKVGADISSTTGPVVLRDIIKKLAALKSMNVSWASDVDQYATVDVDIRADDDFFRSIDNLLRQRDYFHEVQGNTIVINYKETRKFHLAMPFMKSTYSNSVGAQISKNSSTKIDSGGNTFDIWDNIKKNLDQVLQIWEDAATQTPPPVAAQAGAEGTAPPAKVSRPQSAKGYYTIDKPIGLITVTAPRRIIQKVESYFENLKKELYRQISIEAKILEVTVSNEREVGIDWEDLLNSSPLNFNATFGPSTWSQPLGPSSARSFTLSAKSFAVFLSAIEKQGKTKILSNPRISVMNGQPAVINVGREITYIDKVTKSVDGTTGQSTFSPTTDSKTSGVVMSVVPIIMDNNEIILNLTPVTSELEEPIEYKTFSDGTEVGLPKTSIRELSTMVRIKDGEMLVVGGLIDNFDKGEDENVPTLGKLPLIGRLFGLESKVKTKKELVILLRPEIIS